MNGPFGNDFPYTNFHELNMDWIIKIAKDFLDQYSHIQDIITDGETDITNLTSTKMEALQAEYNRLVVLLDQWYTTHSSDIAGQLTQVISDFQTAAEAIGADVIASIPADYTALSDKVNNLKNTIVNSSDNVTWYAGGISGTTGLETDNNSRIKTAFLDRRITAVIPASGYKVTAVGWSANGEFAGAWNGSAFVDTGIVFSTSPLICAAIPANYQIRIIAGKTTDGNVNTSDGANIFFALDINGLAVDTDDSMLKLSDMVTAWINIIQHYTPRSGYYYDGMTQTAADDFVAYPYVFLKSGVTYYYRGIYGALSNYKDLSTNSIVNLGAGWNGSITPSHDSILALTSTPSAASTALLTTSQDMYNSSERQNIFYPTGLYVEKNNIPNNLVNAVKTNMFTGSFDWSGTWGNIANWTTDTNKFQGLVVKKRNNSWSGIYQEITVESGKHYHFNAWVKVSDSKQIQIAFVNSALGSTATVAIESYSPSIAVENISIPARSVAANKWRKINIELIALTSGTIHPLVQLTGTGATIYVCGYSFAEGRCQEKNVYTCMKDGTGDFSKICEAVDWATMYYDSTVYVGAGEWDIVDEFGSTYMEAVQESYNNGNYLKNRIHMVFSSDSVVVANYEGSRETTMECFSPFNSGIYGFTLENINIQCSNVRYCVHDERQTNTDQYTSRYINCKMKLDNSENTGTTTCQCIGGGLGTNGHIIIIGGDYEGINTAHIPSSGYVPISYHNSWGSGKSRIDISNVYIHEGSIRLNWYGPSTDMTECYVTGCSFTHAIVSGPETQDSRSENENIEIIAWNNEIRT